MEEIYNNLREIIKIAMICKNYTVASLSKELPVTYYTLNRFLKHNQAPYKNTVIYILDGLNLDKQEVFSLAKTKFDKLNYVEKVVDIIKRSKNAS